MTIRSLIIAKFQEVAKRQVRTLPPLSDGLVLLDSGLDSLCFAILVARLEDLTGVDPFTSADDAKFPNTVGELIAFYEHVAA